jgi:hypothetical protein
MCRLKSKVAFPWLAVGTIAILACSRSSSSGPEPAGSTRGGVSPGPSARHDVGSRAARLVNASSTRDVLNTLADDCLSCAEKNGCLDPAQQGGVCEAVTGQARGGRTATEQCLETLRCVFTSKCANTGEQSPCLCGQTDVTECMEGKSPPRGTCVAVYKGDFGSNGKAMYDQFLDRKFGSGQANALIQCVIPLCPTCRIR